MTTFLPLDGTSSFPPSPPFLVASPDPADHVKQVIRAVLRARRIVVVCGAGISVEAGIPDFRSSEGLFQSLKKDHPRLNSGKELFDVSIFRSEDGTSMFCRMIARLSQLSEVAEPTTFHQFLRILDERRSLLRVYTQNIDALEEKSGITFGVPGAASKGISRGSKASAHAGTAPAKELPPDIIHHDEPSTNPAPSPPTETPTCIPLHGTVQLMHCMACPSSYPLCDYMDSLVSGILPDCPRCTALEEIRRRVGKRPHSIGKLRPSVVLYDEEHNDGEVVGQVVQKDLSECLRGKGRRGADLLLVVGTSLRVSGTKRLVREFSQAVRSRHAMMNAHPDQLADKTTLSGLVPPTPSPRRSIGRDDKPPVRTIYLSLDFPVPTRDWEGVFDVWMRGDAQEFARMVHEELEKEKRVKEAAKELKRKREETPTENTTVE